MSVSAVDLITWRGEVTPPGGEPPCEGSSGCARGMELIYMRSGPYEAWAAPAMGGNVLRLRHLPSRTEVLRTPPDIDAFKANPNVYGTPLLLPPNRIYQGAFEFNGRKYRFPINEPSRGNFIHGVMSQTPMDVREMRATKDMACVRLCYRATEARPYITFPHAFTCRIELRLTSSGLTQAFSVRNDSASPMPFGLGIHTAFLIPKDTPCRVHVPVGPEWLLDRAIIRPDGRYAEDTPLHRGLLSEGLLPMAQPVSSLYARLPGPAYIRYPERGVEIRYDVDDGFRFWMLWNAQAREDHFCIEPMTWTVDAPNSPLPPAQSGFDAIPPGQERTLITRLSVRQATE